MMIKRKIDWSIFSVDFFRFRKEKSPDRLFSLAYLHKILEVSRHNLGKFHCFHHTMNGKSGRSLEKKRMRNTEMKFLFNLEKIQKQRIGEIEINDRDGSALKLEKLWKIKSVKNLWKFKKACKVYNTKWRILRSLAEDTRKYGKLTFSERKKPWRLFGSHGTNHVSMGLNRGHSTEEIHGIGGFLRKKEGKWERWEKSWK